MFEKAPALLLTLQNETIRKFSGIDDPMLLGTELFCAALENLPLGKSDEFPYPGIFGLEFTPPEIRKRQRKFVFCYRQSLFPVPAFFINDT